VKSGFSADSAIFAVGNRPEDFVVVIDFQVDDFLNTKIAF
jgi:hypothetical protein